MNKTFIPFNNYSKKKWYVIDAEGKTLGRLSSEVANILQGKNKINFYPSIDNGDYAVITNAKKIKVTGKKEKEKLYRRHSGRPGGMKIETLPNLYLGTQLSLKKMIATKEPKNFKNLYIPGFNRVFSNNLGVGFNYTVSYNIPIINKYK